MEAASNEPHSAIIIANSHGDKRSNLRTQTSISALSLLRSTSERFESLSMVREEQSKQVPSSTSGISLRDGVNVPLLGEVRWDELKIMAWKWLKSPLNLALLLWIVCVAVSGAILFLVMTGMLNAVIPNKSERDTWFEVNNQIINGLFTLMCIILHPARIRAAVLLYQWAPHDIIVMRATFNKGGQRKPHEWKHMVIVVVLLNLNCFLQYALAGVNWGFKREDRPAILVGILLAGAIGCGAGGGIYNALSPLGKDGGILEEGILDKGESEDSISISKPSFQLQELPEDPLWHGGVVTGFCTNARVALLSSLFCVCIFGINQERLGFGNRIVHGISFGLFLLAPFFIISLAAININDSHVRQIVGLIGIIMSLLGVFYGGYWRWRMRVTYKLPKSRWCFCHAGLTDLVTWLLCSCCALAQEVRTAEHYQVWDGKFYHKDTVVDDGVLEKKGFKHVLEMEVLPVELDGAQVESVAMVPPGKVECSRL